MRIAISGSHSLGKSTVVNDWVARHPDYLREEEPYRALGLYGPYEILFREASTKLHNGIQMFYSISRIHRFGSSTDRVARILGIVLMAVGVLGTFLAYNNSRSLVLLARLEYAFDF